MVPEVHKTFVGLGLEVVFEFNCLVWAFWQFVVGFFVFGFFLVLYQYECVC